MSMLNFYSKLKQKMGFQESDFKSEKNDDLDITLKNTTESADEEDYLLVSVSAKKPKIEATLQPQMILDEQLVLNGDCVSVSELSELHRSEMSHHNPLSLVLDVPFKLHPVLDAQIQASTIFSDFNLEPCVFNRMKYSHNFMSEKLCLRDMNCDEMVDIDEFLLPQVKSQTSDYVSSKESEVNLMQF